MTCYNPIENKFTLRNRNLVDNYFDDSGWNHGRFRNIDIHGALRNLNDQLRAYDTLRTTLERKGGRVDDLKRITEILTTPVCITTRAGNADIPLDDPRALRRIINDVDRDLHLDVRQLHTHMPVYYICRVHHDFWSEYSLIVEDYYMSPGYPLPDERFVKLMESGHEAYHLRLSQFREDITRSAAGTDDTSPEKIDSILYGLSRHVFQAAWHDDQRLGMLVAKHMELPCFRNAVELLYLCLSGDMCELRSAVDESMLRFFKKNYPQPALYDFLTILVRLDGRALTDIALKAAGLYQRLSKAFSRFLAVEVTWGLRKSSMPLWKLIYANISRLDLVAGSLKWQWEFIRASKQLEREAKSITDELLAIERKS